MDQYQGGKFIDDLIYKGVSEWSHFVDFHCFSLNPLFLFSFYENSEFLLILGVDASLQQLTTEVIIRQQIYDIFRVRLWLCYYFTSFFFSVLFSPIDKFDHPIEGLGLDKVKGDVLAMPFDNGGSIEDVDIVESFGIDTHDLKSFRLLTQCLHTCQSSLHFVSARQHLLNEEIVFLYLTLLNVFRLQIWKWISNARTAVIFLMTIEASHSTAFHSASWASVLIKGSRADITQLFAGSMFGRDEL